MPAQYSSSCRIFELLNQSQSYVPLTSSTITTTVNRSPSDLQEALNELAGHATNLGRGCGVAIRKAVIGAKELCQKIDAIVESSSVEFFGLFSPKAEAVKACERHVKQVENKLKSCYSLVGP